MIEGSLVRLRSWREGDLPSLAALRNNVHLQAKRLARARGSDADTVRAWLERRSTQDGSVFFVIADKPTDSPIGYLQFTGIDPVDLNADLGVCLAPEAQGKGIGGEAMRIALLYLRTVGRVRKVSLRVRSDNAPAIALYRHLGFIVCGEQKAHAYFDNAWQDVLLMEMFLDASPQ